MDKKLANAQKTCKFTKKYADINIGIVAPSKNLQMHKILAKRQIRRYLTKYLQIHYQIIHATLSPPTPPTMVLESLLPRFSCLRHIAALPISLCLHRCCSHSRHCCVSPSSIFHEPRSSSIRPDSFRAALTEPTSCFRRRHHRINHRRCFVLVAAAAPLPFAPIAAEGTSPC
jgi:hypothetical protein